MRGLHTDLYELTMAAGYWQAGKTNEVATFELFVREAPPHRNFMVAAGLQQAAEYLLNLRFTDEEIEFLRTTPQVSKADPEFFDVLRDFRFRGDLWSVPEGTPVFPGEPILIVRAPLIEAQIPETYLLSMVGFQTMIATKAARMREAAQGRAVVEFGTRRAHSPEAGVLAGRASYIGGCAGTSNTLAGMRYGVPVYGTSAHSWIMSFPTELEAFERLQHLLGAQTIYLIDSYDTLEGARLAASLGEPLWGVRLDSGNLDKLSREVREILDVAGLKRAKIMATGNLNEHSIRDFVTKDTPIDVFGVGTELATSLDSPSHGAVYKMVELVSERGRRYTAKYSAAKLSYPGAKQVFRYAAHDVVGLQNECPVGDCQALLRPVIFQGELLEALPSAAQAREHAMTCVDRLPADVRSLDQHPTHWPVTQSEKLQQLAAEVKRDHGGDSV
jgi:nicotinate phosphoribosyltransferase